MIYPLIRLDPLIHWYRMMSTIARNRHLKNVLRNCRKEPAPKIGRKNTKALAIDAYPLIAFTYRQCTSEHGREIYLPFQSGNVGLTYFLMKHLERIGNTFLVPIQISANFCICEHCIAFVYPNTESLFYTFLQSNQVIVWGFFHWQEIHFRYKW